MRWKEIRLRTSTFDLCLTVDSVDHIKSCHCITEHHLAQGPIKHNELIFISSSFPFSGIKWLGENVFINVFLINWQRREELRVYRFYSLARWQIMIAFGRLRSSRFSKIISMDGMGRRTRLLIDEWRAALPQEQLKLCEWLTFVGVKYLALLLIVVLSLINW